MKFDVVPYNPAWPKQFEIIKMTLAADLADQKAKYISIEHIGSTAVPGLPAKPVLDIIIIIEDESCLNGVTEALVWGEHQGGHKHIGDGGVEGRWSFKLYGVSPERNVYVVVEGGLPQRSYLDLRDTLRKEPELREKYGIVKLRLAEWEWIDVMQYATAKNGIIRRILEKAGWDEGDIDEKERRSVTSWTGCLNAY